MKLHLQIYDSSSPWKKLMELRNTHGSPPTSMCEANSFQGKNNFLHCVTTEINVLKMPSSVNMHSLSFHCKRLATIFIYVNAENTTVIVTMELPLNIQQLLKKQ